MNNLDKLKKDIEKKVDDKTTLKELAIEVQEMKEVMTTLIDLIKTRNF